MYDSVCRRSVRVFIVGVLLSAVLGPSSASAQSVDIYPWENIQQVVNNHPAGTTFLLKGGVHRLQTITPRSGDRFIGEAGTVLSGARQLSEFSRSGAIITPVSVPERHPCFNARPFITTAVSESSALEMARSSSRMRSHTTISLG